MDPISQAALGAAVGHAFFHRQLGMKAAGIGALAGMFPDIDTFYGTMEGPFARLVSHRGTTHSLFFGPVVGTVVGWLWWRRRSGRMEPAKAASPGPWVWIGLFVLALVSHPLLDLFTHYGTQLLSPISRTRFGLPAVPVLDPAYTVILGMGILLGALWRRSPRAGWFTALALVLSTAYLFSGLRVNGLAEAEARRQLVADGVPSPEVYAFPTMLQIFYRRIVAFTPSEVRVGYISMWRPCPIYWATAPRRNDERVTALKRTEEGRIFSWFARGRLGNRIVETDGRQIVELSDLRYGFDWDAESGMWGIRVALDNDGQVLGPPERFRNRPKVSRENIAWLWDRAFPASCEDTADTGVLGGQSPAGTVPGRLSP